MIKTSCIFLLLVPGPLLLPQTRTPETLESHEWPQQGLERVVLVADRDFNSANLQALFTRMVAERGDSSLLMTVTVLTDRGALHRDLKGGLDYSYAFWQREYNKYRGAIPASAQLISIRGNASMRIRYPSGQVEDARISGRSPTELGVGPATYRLARVNLLSSGPLRDTLAPTFYFWGPGPSESVGRALLERELAETGLTYAKVSLERAPVFEDDGEFPVLYPYQRIAAPPDEASYNANLRVHCSNEYGKITCLTYGGK